MAWWVYVIECASGAWYAGIATDLERRFHEHAAGKGAKYFRLDQPKRIVAVQGCKSRSEASRLENLLKKLDRRAKAAWIAQHPYLSAPAPTAAA